jgi:hypothetical protein
MGLKGAKPGKFHPRCPSCSEKFSLVIPQDPSVVPTVAKDPDELDETLTPAIAVALGIEAPLAQRAMAGAASSPPQRMIASPRVAPQQTAPPIVQNPVPPEQPPAPVGLSAAPADVPPPAAADQPEDRPLTGRVGGYQILQKLGQGGMGSVYLARQLSLDRNVALKVLAPSLASDPQFVARFTREAYAAAQLTHHNIVQIHDIGAQDSIHYFSMEFVEGDNLGATVKEAGKLDPEAAAGYVLQAARGLKFAHDHGMIHRDIKPENLLLNDSGIVKVADLGLVKRAGSLDETQITGVPHPAQSDDQTQLNTSMGTPAYMPPEQARDAAHVDQRADIYALGCTLYDLLTGRPPFMGRTAIEVITKHQREQITPPEMIVRNVPRTLSAILLKMVAKRPDDRYQTMNEVIHALEDFLGVSAAGPFTPKEEHVKVLEFAVERFNRSGWAVLRSQLIHLFFAACAIATAILVWTAHPLWAAGIIGFGVLTTIVYQAIIGVSQHAYLFGKFRQLVFGSSIVDWLSWIAIGALVVMLLIVSGWHWPWFVACILAIMVALGFHSSIDLMLVRDRTTPVAQVEAMLKQMRLRGLDEMTMRQFVCKYSGNRWEELYETLFGYDAKIQARHLWGKSDRGRLRKKHAAWRDPIIRWIDNKQTARREAREQKMLQKVEAKALRAKGINEALANKQARKNAQKVIDSAARMRSTAEKRLAETAAPSAAPPTKAGMTIQVVQPDWVQDSGKIAAADEVEKKHHEEEEAEREHLSWFQRRFGTPLDFALGQQVRFILAMFVLAGFALWWQQNKGQEALQQGAQIIGSKREVIDVTAKDFSKNVTSVVKDTAKDVAQGLQKASDTTTQKTLELPLVPLRVREALTGWNAALAGLILLVSVFCHGRLMSVTILLAAAVAMIGHRVNLPVVAVPAAWVSALAASIIALFALVFLRKPEGY